MFDSVFKVEKNRNTVIGAILILINRSLNFRIVGLTIIILIPIDLMVLINNKVVCFFIFFVIFGDSLITFFGEYYFYIYNYV